jgi:hypothetical protein
MPEASGHPKDADGSSTGCESTTRQTVHPDSSSSNRTPFMLREPVARSSGPMPTGGRSRGTSNVKSKAERRRRRNMGWK